MTTLRHCQICKIQFLSRQYNGKFCSLRCRTKYNIPLDNPTRFFIFKRDGFRCFYCGRNPNKFDITLEIDHIRPRSSGGSNKDSNLITACRDCNRGKRHFVLSKEDLANLKEGSTYPHVGTSVGTDEVVH